MLLFQMFFKWNGRKGQKKIYGIIYMFGFLFGKYFYYYDLIKIIDEIENDRKKLRLIGETMSSTFPQDLKLRLLSN